MSQDTNVPERSETSFSLLRLGGACYILFVLIIVGYLALFNFFALNTAAQNGIFSLATVIQYVILVPAVLGLYVALERTRRTLALTAALLVIGESVLTILSIALLSAYSNQIQVITTGLDSIADVLFGIVMLRGVFTRSIAYLGIAVGILSAASGAAFVLQPTGEVFALVSLLSLVALVIWYTSLGTRLYRLGGARGMTPEEQVYHI